MTMKKKHLALMICAITGGAFLTLQPGNQQPKQTKTNNTPSPSIAIQQQSIPSNQQNTQTSEPVQVFEPEFIALSPTSEPSYFFIAQTPHENGKGTVLVTPPDATIKIKNASDAKRLILEGGSEHLNLGKNDNVEIISTKKDKLGNTYYKYKQTYKGIPVDGRELVVEASKEDNSKMLAGFFESNINISTDPELVGSQALNLALSSETPIIHKEPELKVFVGNTEPQLVYHSVVQYDSDVDGLHLDEIYVDANTGKVISTITRIHTGLSRSINTKNGQCIRSTNELPGSYLFGESGPSSNSPQYAKDAFKNLGISYQFYKHLLQRDSLDNRGMLLKATVHVKLDQGRGCQGDNAFFMGAPLNLMVFAEDGQYLVNPAGALDITAHELTHGVTSTESNLKYQNESGAINEALSDIFGSGAEAWSHSGGSTSGNPSQGIKPTQNNWTLGETAAQTNNMRRYFYDPQKDGQSKDSYQSRNVCQSSSNCPDSGYVHTNSGIMNLAFYLLSQGGTHPRNTTSNQVNGIGIEKALRIYYHAAINTFTSSTGFQTARTLLAKSAETIYGKCSTEWTAVNESYDAVQVPGTWTKCSGGGGGGGTGGGSGSACATESLTNNLNQGTQVQQSLRSFRDEQLSQSELGKRIEQLYYKHTDEIKELIKSDWILRLSGLRLIMRATYSLKQDGDKFVPLNNGYSRLAALFLDRANKKGSDELKNDMGELKDLISQLKGLTKKDMLALIGIAPLPSP